MTKAKRVAIYTRVSTDGQSVASQLRELHDVAERHGWNVVAEYSDPGVSGTKGRDKRPGFDKLLKAATRREIDMIAAWSVDRLGRSLQHLVAFLGEINAAGVDLYLHTQGLDTSTPAGRAMFGMLSVFGEFERAMIVERVTAGVRRAKAQGTKSGRPIGRPEIEPAIRAKVLRALAGGKGINAIGRDLKISPGTVRNIRDKENAQ
jgi:DNA invertase Pin-like site-specific DNA recombinase